MSTNEVWRRVDGNDRGAFFLKYDEEDKSIARRYQWAKFLGIVKVSESEGLRKWHLWQ